MSRLRDRLTRRRSSASKRLTPNAQVDGQPIRVLGDPFRIWPAGCTWIAGVCGDGKVRPFRAEAVQRIGAGS